MGRVYKHWGEFPMSEWRWPNFSPEEMASKREGELLIDAPSMDKLQKLRDTLGKPLLITSAYRSAAHNASLPGAAKNSQHRLGKAFDVVMTNQDPHHFMQVARAVGFTGIGTYPGSNFIHIDTGPSRSWGTPWPRTEKPTPGFPTELRPETLAERLKRPEVLLPGAGAVVTGAAPLAQGNGPVQIAIGVVLVLLVLAFIGFVAIKLLRRPADV